MSNIINHLQHRVQESKQKLQGLADQIQQLNLEKETVSVDLLGYERALAAEMRAGGMDVPKSAEQDDLPLNTEPGSEINKTEFARRFIRGRPDSGATPADILKGFQDAGIPIKKPYVYALVQRLQEQTAIKKKRGKWFPVAESERPQAGDANEIGA